MQGESKGSCLRFFKQLWLSDFSFFYVCNYICNQTDVYAFGRLVTYVLAHAKIASGPEVSSTSDFCWLEELAEWCQYRLDERPQAWEVLQHLEDKLVEVSATIG